MKTKEELSVTMLNEHIEGVNLQGVRLSSAAVAVPRRAAATRRSDAPRSTTREATTGMEKSTSVAVTAAAERRVDVNGGVARFLCCKFEGAHLSSPNALKGRRGGVIRSAVGSRRDALARSRCGYDSGAEGSLIRRVIEDTFIRSNLKCSLVEGTVSSGPCTCGWSKGHTREVAKGSWPEARWPKAAGPRRGGQRQLARGEVAGGEEAKGEMNEIHTRTCDASGRPCRRGGICRRVRIPIQPAWCNADASDNNYDDYLWNVKYDSWSLATELLGCGLYCGAVESWKMNPEGERTEVQNSPAFHNIICCHLPRVCKTNHVIVINDNQAM
ncbi:unnamed protein product [Chrysodeixis includens]|uniref:Uncharacterized protein n=1 Tax=Chrysodeixis includens TaxID=689277 RepID=A0A9N8L1V2_CHRIL|nr:unnamed protein product [Chrysodeixis includens]